MQPPSNFESDIPVRIGPFRILRKLGEGGMGVVYLGERVEQFSQQVAIKILHPHLFPASAEAAIERESQVLAALDHPGIVRMLDLGVSDANKRYIVMEYVDGIRIDEYCDLQNLSIRRRIEMLLHVFEAVEYAHRHLVIHADLKPANILVTKDGNPRLLDFGVATVLSDQMTADNSAARYTELYSSPEQQAGERLTVASDIYSMGLIAQAILTGQPPKPVAIGAASTGLQESSTATSAKALKALSSASLESIAMHRDTTAKGLISSVSGDIEAILAKALQVNPQDRFHSVQEMHDEFRRHLFGYPIQVRPSGAATRMRKWIVRNKLAASFASVSLMVVILTSFGVIYQAMDASRKRQIARDRLHELVRLTDVLAGDLYESVHGLQGGEKAQAALLESAHRTIDQLAGEEAHDPQLEMELVLEYKKLAQLELRSQPDSPAAARQAAEDLNKGIALLSGLPSSEEGNARKLASELTSFRDSIPKR